MLTVRTYLNPAQAALAKSLLDNYEICCVLLDENSSVYLRGGQFAVPIRLTVDENEVDRAIAILNADFESAAEVETHEDAGSVQTDEPIDENGNRNPWELLVLAFYLAVPAICLIYTRFPRPQLFTIMFMMAVVTTASASPLFHWLMRKPAQRAGVLEESAAEETSYLVPESLSV